MLQKEAKVFPRSADKKGNLFEGGFMKQMINIEIQAADPDTQAVLTLNRLLAMSLINAGFRQSDGPALETHVTGEILDVEVSLCIDSARGRDSTHVFLSKASLPPRPSKEAIAEAVKSNIVDWEAKIAALFSMGSATVYGSRESTVFDMILINLKLSFRIDYIGGDLEAYTYTLATPKD